MIDISAAGQEVDIPARMAEIVGAPPRILPVDQGELTEEQLQLINGFRGRTGPVPDDVPELYRTIIKTPALFPLLLMKATVFLTQGAIDPRDRELAILRVGWLCRAPYEWGQHVIVAKKCGITSDEIERVTEGSSAPGWTEHERAILRGVEELLRNQMISDETWNIMAKTWSEEQLMEFPLLVGNYVQVAFQQNALRFRLPADSPGLDAR